MPNQRAKLILLLVLQAVAIVIYPFSFFRQAPQAAILPPALFVLFLVALFAMNSGGMSPIGGRSSLGLIQGINIVVRLMMFLPNLEGADASWNWALLIAQVVGMGLSWYALTQMEKLPPNSLLLIPKPK